jgi:hypothetical protein
MSTCHDHNKQSTVLRLFGQFGQLPLDAQVVGMLLNAVEMGASTSTNTSLSYFNPPEKGPSSSALVYPIAAPTPFVIVRHPGERRVTLLHRPAVMSHLFLRRDLTSGRNVPHPPTASACSAGTPFGGALRNRSTPRESASARARDKSKMANAGRVGRPEAR